MKNVWVFIVAIPMFSCQTIGHKYIDSHVDSGSYDTVSQNKDEALRLLSTVENTNKNLETFKGIGNFKLITKNKSLHTRAAWIGTNKGYFRIEIFGFPGQSAATYSHDGRYSYMYIHLEDRFYIINDVNPSLEKILTIPITSNDLNSFLSGKIPIYDYDVNHMQVKLSGNVYELHLKQGCFGNREKIYVDEHTKYIQKVEIFNQFGSLIYCAELRMMKTVNGHIIPFDIKISNNDDNYLHISMEKYWTDIDIPLSSFTLTHPN